jgi:membrane protein DedA with SNARE-associated domain
MGSTPHAWWDWGYGGIFICVFLEQIGVPIPAFPALLAAGALVAAGELHLTGCLLTAVAAALLADLIWYQIGKIQGGTVLNLMCRLSFSRNSFPGSASWRRHSPAWRAFPSDASSSSTASALSPGPWSR